MNWPDPEEKGNQRIFANMVGVTQAAISTGIKNGILKKDGTFGEWHAVYIQNLRDKAAGRTDNIKLTDARIADVLAAAELKQLQLAEKAGQLVDVAAIEPAWRDWAAVGRRSIQNAGERIKEALESRLKAEGVVDFDFTTEIVDKPLSDALRDIARFPKMSGPDDFSSSEGVDTEDTGSDDQVGGGESAAA